MAWGKKPWQGGGKGHTKKVLQEGYNYEAGNINSQYQSRRETKNTITGFLLLTLCTVGTILLLHWIAIYFS